ncbi:unnamed protein product, partial [Musa acuminata var. zebrina]
LDNSFEGSKSTGGKRFNQEWQVGVVAMVVLEEAL